MTQGEICSRPYKVRELCTILSRILMVLKTKTVKFFEMGPVLGFSIFIVELSDFFSFYQIDSMSGS